MRIRRETEKMNTLTDKRVRARKEHKCDYCSKVIEIGEEYRYGVYTNEAMIYSWRSCDRCRFYVTKAFKELGDYVADGLGEQDFKDFMWESHREVAVEWWKYDACR
jgi:hypothetical protein